MIHISVGLLWEPRHIEQHNGRRHPGNGNSVKTPCFKWFEDPAGTNEWRRMASRVHDYAVVDARMKIFRDFSGKYSFIILIWSEIERCCCCMLFLLGMYHVDKTKTVPSFLRNESPFIEKITLENIHSLTYISCTRTHACIPPATLLAWENKTLGKKTHHARIEKPYSALVLPYIK